MSLLLHNCWLQRAIVVVAALGVCAITLPMKPAEAAFVAVGATPPGYYYPPAPACAYYYPYGCYGYAAPYYAPAGVVVVGWGGWGWGSPCWGCGRLVHDGRFFFDRGRFFHDGRFFFHDGRFFRDGRFFFDDGRFFRDGRFFHSGFGGPGMMHGGFGGGGMMHGGPAGGRR